MVKIFCTSSHGGSSFKYLEFLSQQISDPRGWSYVSFRQRAFAFWLSRFQGIYSSTSHDPPSRNRGLSNFRAAPVWGSSQRFLEANDWLKKGLSLIRARLYEEAGGSVACSLGPLRGCRLPASSSFPSPSLAALLRFPLKPRT